MHETAEIVDKGAPASVGPVAMPFGKLGRVGQFEDDRTVARLDDRRDELVASIGERRLGADPARCDRPRRPQDDDRFCVPELLLDHFVEGFARVEGGVPPDVESFLAQALRKGARDRAVGSSIGQKNISSGHAPPGPARKKSGMSCHRDLTGES